jgi:hypothetical protein
MIWRGPEVDGITQSMISKFVQCPYRFYLYAILGLKDNSELHPNLIWGDVFHKGLEHYIKTRNINNSVVAMHDYLATKYPQAPSTYDKTTKGLLWKFSLSTYEGEWDTEIAFAIPVTLPSGRKVLVRGKKDALCIDHPQYGRCLGEHKCKGWIDPAQVRREIKQDRQLNVYMYLHHIEWVNYDLILIPEAQKYLPARSYNESPAEWIQKLFIGPCASYNGKFPINQNVHEWIHSSTYHLPREEQEAYWNFTIFPELERMCRFWDHVNQPGFDPDNPDYYNEVFYRAPVRQFNGSFTQNFECDYYKHLIGEEDLCDLLPVSSLYSELEDL